MNQWGIVDCASRPFAKQKNVSAIDCAVRLIHVSFRSWAQLEAE